MTVVFLWPIVLVAAFAYDFSITRYVVAVEERASVRAGIWSVGTYLVGLIGTVGILKVSPWLIIPECIGLFLGTLAGVSMKKVGNDNQDDEW
jgi:hypothetical protein